MPENVARFSGLPGPEHNQILRERPESMNVTHLECAACHLEHEARRLLNLCRECGQPLLVRYDLERVRTADKGIVSARRAFWRYREVLRLKTARTSFRWRRVDAAASRGTSRTKTWNRETLH